MLNMKLQIRCSELMWCVDFAERESVMLLLDQATLDEVGQLCEGENQMTQDPRDDYAHSSFPFLT